MFEYFKTKNLCDSIHHNTHLFMYVRVDTAWYAWRCYSVRYRRENRGKRKQTRRKRRRRRVERSSRRAGHNDLRTNYCRRASRQCVRAREREDLLNLRLLPRHDNRYTAVGFRRSGLTIATGSASATSRFAWREKGVAGLRVSCR